MNKKLLIIFLAFLFPVFVSGATGDIYNEPYGDATVLVGQVGELRWTPLINATVGSFSYMGRYFHAFSGSDTLRYELWSWNGSFIEGFDCTSVEQSFIAWGLSPYNTGPTSEVVVAMSGSECAVNTGTQYAMRGVRQGTDYTSSGDYATAPTGATQVSQMSLIVSSGSLPNFTTRIIGIIPVNQGVVSSTTPTVLNANIFVNDDDFSDNMFVRFDLFRQQNMQMTLSGLQTRIVIDVPIQSAGETDVGTTTASLLNNGEYLYTVSIRKPSIINRILNWFQLGNLYDPGVLAKSNTRFIVGEKTGLDVFIDDQAQLLEDTLNNPGVLSVNLSGCNPLTFSIMECLTALFVPSQAQMQTFFDRLMSDFLNRAPIGYVLRLGQIIDTSATSSLPVISYEFGDESPLDGEIISFDFTETMSSSSNILSTVLVSDRDEPKSVFDILMPFWEVFVYFSMFVLVLRDIAGLYRNRETP